MSKPVTLTINGREITVPEGTLVVDAAKKLGIDIPVFCYHPKMEPVGMCRMCLVEIGRPVIDRATGLPQLEADGSPRINFGPKLDTACTTPVTPGMVVIEASEKVKTARKDVLEFLLTSHPLDCPICDKGGECPLQNLTMGYGPGESRFLYDEKMRLEKRVPLGDLILLDRERCIQCGRCVRFQTDLADDPVIGFYQRGRKLEIVTYSEPGFDSYFSGNTTDICPVGALATADFRFGARAWELSSAASICPHCPVGCNLTINIRREANSGGNVAIKRVMPRQNEAVNEIWMCDKGRFGYHFAESSERLTQPLLRQGDALVPAAWDAALERVASHLKTAGTGLVSLVGGRLANEDLFNIHQLTTAQGGQALLYTDMGGGDLVSQVGLSQDSNFASMGRETAILVVACDLKEEAPVWWLRVRQAAKRGAKLIVLSPRPNRLSRVAAFTQQYAYGEEAAVVRSFMPGSVELFNLSARAFAEAENGVILFGSEGLGLAASQALAQACADLLVTTGHVGKPNNGLVGVWPRANDQGAWEVGFRPSNGTWGEHPGAGLPAVLAQSSLVYIAGADPAGDDPALGEALKKAGFVVVQELFMTETARQADVVLPAQAFTEREGSFTSGERRVQRYYQVLSARPGPLPDYAITAQLSQRLGKPLESRAAGLVFAGMAATLPAFAGLNYQALGAVTPQWPIVGRQDLYYGGSTYDNQQGLGVQLALNEKNAINSVPVGEVKLPEVPAGAILALPVTCLYDRGQTLLPSPLLQNHLVGPSVRLHPQQADALGLEGHARLRLEGRAYRVAVVRDESVPPDRVLVPRSVGLPIIAPVAVVLEKSE